MAQSHVSNDIPKSRHGRVILWCTPRSVSTAIAKCLTAIEGNEVWIEPFGYSHRAGTELKRKDNVEMPMKVDGNQQVLQRAADLLSDFFNTTIFPERLPYATIKQSLEKSPSQYVFVKDMSISMMDDRCREYMPVGFKHTFLIRHPTLVYESYRRTLYKVLLERGSLDDATDESKFDIVKDDFGLPPTDIYKAHYELWIFVQRHIDPSPILMDADDLLENPAEMLSKYCELVRLPYSDALLKWDSSPESIKHWKLSSDDRLRHASHFVDVVLSSTNFMARAKPLPRDQLTDDVIRVSDAVMPYYREMYENRLKPSVSL